MICVRRCRTCAAAEGSDPAGPGVAHPLHNSTDAARQQPAQEIAREVEETRSGCIRRVEQSRLISQARSPQVGTRSTASDEEALRAPLSWFTRWVEGASERGLQAAAGVAQMRSHGRGRPVMVAAE